MISTLDELARAANLRDLGGHLAANGMRVRRGCIYRSALLTALSPDMVLGVKELRLSTIIDLRANREREAFPTPWEALGCGEYWSRDHAHDASDIRRMMRDTPTASPTVMREVMHDLYREIPYQHEQSYTTLFSRLTEGRTPVLFHCAAGKDRTGVAAALILAALGVPMEDIVSDYLRTNAFDLRNSPMMRRGSGADGFHGFPEALLQPLLAADSEYLLKMFESICSRHGSVEKYLDSVLGVGQKHLEQMRDHLLEPMH